MNKWGKKVRIWVFIAVAAVLGVTLTVACVTCLGGKTLDFDADFYYVCYKSPPDDSSMVSVSSLVHSYGGAGYIVNCNGKSFVTVSCYYSENDANTVCNQLKKRGLNCTVEKAETPKRKLGAKTKQNAAKYEGNLNTLLSVSRTCYDLANSVDKCEVNQKAAKSVLSEINVALKGLYSANGNNCFSGELDYLITECEDISYGYVFSYDIRRLQIAVCDCIVNVNIY